MLRCRCHMPGSYAGEGGRCEVVEGGLGLGICASGTCLTLTFYRRLGAVESAGGDAPRLLLLLLEKGRHAALAMWYGTGEILPVGGTSTRAGMPHSSGSSSSPFATGEQVASRWPLMTGASSPHASCFGECRAGYRDYLGSFILCIYIAESRVSRRGPRRCADVRLLHHLQPLVATRLMAYHRRGPGP